MDRVIIAMTNQVERTKVNSVINNEQQLRHLTLMMFQWSMMKHIKVYAFIQIMV